MRTTVAVSVAWMALAGGLTAQANEVRVWELPARATLDNRTGWKPAEAGTKSRNGFVLDNGKVVLLAVPGSGGVALSAAGKGAGSIAEIGAVAATGQAGKIESVRLVKSDETEATVEVTFEGATVSLRVEVENCVAEVTPAKGAAALELRGKTAYAVLPDFFGFDTVFDPKRYTSDRIIPPAENFLLNLQEGGDAIVVCAWQGTLSLGKESKGGEKDPQVELFFSGQGGERRLARSRIEFQGRPVFVALMAGDGIWHQQEIGGEPAQKPIELAWKRPFEAKWRANFLGREGAYSSDHLSGNLTADLAHPGEAVRWDTDGLPRISMQGLWPYFVYAFWAGKGTNATYVAAYADQPLRRKAEMDNGGLRAEAKKQGTPFVEVYPTNIYQTVIVYPLDRRPETPLNAWTFTDTMRESLGQGPCAYVLDLEGVTGRKTGGTRNTLATCGTWDTYLLRFAKGIFGGMKVPVGGKDKMVVCPAPGTRIEPEAEAFLAEKLEDQVLFVTAVNERLREYRKFSDEVVDVCRQAERDIPAAKELAGRILKPALQLQQRNSEKGLTELTAKRDQWDVKMKGVIAEVKSGVYTNVLSTGNIRDYAEAQDILVAFCRRCTKSIRLEASVADLSDPEALNFANRVRTMSHEALRNKHQMEGW